MSWWVRQHLLALLVPIRPVTSIDCPALQAEIIHVIAALGDRRRRGNARPGQL